MMKKILTTLLCVGAITLNAAEKPNLVIILADDFGYGSLSSYGATKVQTPHIDGLAREGMRFTDAHTTSAVCGPSRYSLMTGTYPFRNPQFVPQSRWSEGFGIRANDVTLAEMLRANGYRTGIFGKWHLGIGFDPQPDLNQPIPGTAKDAGFDESLTDFANLAMKLYIENGKVVGLDPADPLRWKAAQGKEWQVTGGEKARSAVKPECAKRFTERAVKFIDETPAETPFFLYFPTHAVHIPIVTGSEFAGKSQAGPYGDYIMELDWMVGEVLAALERKGVAENTMVVFSSDNGGAYWQGEAANALTKHGLRLNGPLLGQKTDLWEGGHRVPLIVRWPGKVRPGIQSDALVSLVDMLATTKEAFGLKAPAHAGPDSRSFLPARRRSMPDTKTAGASPCGPGRGFTYRSSAAEATPAKSQQAASPHSGSLKSECPTAISGRKASCFPMPPQPNSTTLKRTSLRPPT